MTDAPCRTAEAIVSFSGMAAQLADEPELPGASVRLGLGTAAAGCWSAPVPAAALEPPESGDEAGPAAGADEEYVAPRGMPVIARPRSRPRTRPRRSRRPRRR